MEVLFDFNGSKRLLKATSHQALADLVLKEIVRYNPNATLRFDLEQESTSEQRSQYIVQKWSKKWESYIDVDLSDVEDGDKISATQSSVAVSTM